MLAEADSMVIKRDPRLGRKRVTSLLLWKEKPLKNISKRPLLRIERCRSSMDNKLSMLVREMMEILWLQLLIGKTLIKPIPIRRIKRILVWWTAVRSIEKWERLSNYTPILPPIQMIRQLILDLINSKTISRELVWLQTQVGVIKVVMQSPKILESLVLLTWDNSNSSQMFCIKLITQNSNLLAKKEWILITTITLKMAHLKVPLPKNLIKVSLQQVITGWTTLTTRSNCKQEMVMITMKEIKDRRSLLQILITMASELVVPIRFRMSTLKRRMPIFHGPKSHLLQRNKSFYHRTW